MDGFKTIDELAAVFGLQKQTIMGYVRRKAIPGAVKVFNRWYVPDSTIDDLMAGRITLTKPEPEVEP